MVKKWDFESDAVGWLNWELGAAWLIWDAHEVVRLEVLFALPAIGDEGVVTPGGAEVEAGEVGGEGRAGMVRRQPVVAEEHRRFIGAVAGHTADFVGRGITRHVKGFRHRQVADAGLSREIPPAHPDGMARDAFFVVKQVSVRHLHFGAFEDVVHGAMFGAHALGTGVEEGGVGKALTKQSGDALDVPAGVHGAEGAEVEEHGEAFHPLQPVDPFVHAAGELLEADAKAAVAVQSAGAEPVAVAIRSVVEDGVVFVIAHDGVGVAAFDHGAHEVEDFTDLGAAVDVVAQEDDFPAVRMAKAAAVGLVAEMVEEGEKLGVLAVDIANEIKAG